VTAALVAARIVCEVSSMVSLLPGASWYGETPAWYHAARIRRTPLSVALGWTSARPSPGVNL
jgi:hypothetical protein